jgi:hypothetical protein
MSKWLKQIINFKIYKMKQNNSEKKTACRFFCATYFIFFLVYFL